MTSFKGSHKAGAVGVLLLCAAIGANAQEPVANSTSNSATSTEPVIGPPRLRDFQLEPRERIVTQPTPQPSEAEPVAPADGPARQRSPQARPQPQQQPQPQRQSTQQPAPQPSAPSADAPVSPGPAVEAPIPAQPSQSPALPAEDRASEPTQPGPTAEAEGTSEAASQAEAQGASAWWPYALLLLLLGGGLFAWSRRGRSRTADPEAAGEPVGPMAGEAVPAEFEQERPMPLPRAWLDLELKVERASFTETEWVVQFQLSMSNPTEVMAENVRIDIRLFNAGKEQDKEIGAFFRTAGRETTKLHLPSISPGASGTIEGEVAMPIAEMRGMKLEDRTLFIPVIAVNGLYQWSEGRSGQTAKSYVIGRELQQPSEKMGAFRVDQGPRVWRSVGQRPHKLARRF